jgi:hypothetical protein
VISFKEIGVKDFTLGLEYEALILNFKSTPKKRKSYKENEFLVFEEVTYLLHKRRIVTYDFSLKDNKLIGYTFKIKIENNKYGLNYFEKVLKKLQIKNKNKFIIGDEYAFMETNKKCKKFFRFCQLDFNNYIYGGISYNEE